MERDAGSKIDFLMRVTNTQNAVLAHALNFDASYISRIRSGKRGLPTKQPFVEPASEFFARNLREAYQREALATELGIAGPWPKDNAAATSLIANWIDETLPRDSGPDAARAAAAPVSADEAKPASPNEQTLYFTGNAGRRAAALAFLSEVARLNSPCNLLLQSDEDMSWMIDDESFSQRWAALMGELVAKGCKITIVHTLSRDMNEMWEGVRKWLPLYMAGTVEPYYYPKLRDGIRSRSLFVASGLCALSANSVKNAEEDALVELLHDKTAIKALESEFAAYLALCNPLMKPVSRQGRDALATCITSFLDSDAPIATAADGDVIICAK